MLYTININLNQNELQNAIVQPLAAPPSNPKLGQIYTNSVSKRLMQYNGEKWEMVGAIIDSSATNGNIIVDGIEMTVYELPKASKSVLGGIKVGAGLAVDNDGVLSATGGGTADSVDWKNVLNRPTKLSEFANDAGFIDNTSVNLINYYLKTETYTKNEVNSLIDAIAGFNILKVDSLPTSNISTNVLYLVPKTASQTDNIYDEWIYVNGNWEKIGDTEINLENYLQKTGNASDTTVAFIEPSENVLFKSGDSLAIIVASIYKHLHSLSVVAFSGDYNDLTNKLNINVITVKLSSGETSVTSPVISGKLINVSTYDTVTNEVLMCDIAINNITVSTFEVVVTISAPYENAIGVDISYVTGGII